MAEVAEVIQVEQSLTETQPSLSVIVAGQPLAELPQDLYIPPDALKVFLEIFTGPLDLLLYLIKKQNLDILNIPIARITEQYLSYIDLMDGMRFELAAEYLVMAAMLAEIKSRLLLPRAPGLEETEEVDPRVELVRRLQAYEQIKNAAELLDAIERMERDIFLVNVDAEIKIQEKALPQVSLPEMLTALREVLQRAKLHTRHEIKFETLTLRERMSEILDRLRTEEFVEFTMLFNINEGRAGVVITFIAILELSKQHLLEITQVSPLSQIHVKSRGSESSEYTTETDH